ncbi:hypothetical protein BC829DRAFT_385037 [Chytridium lagenaria]|nr:hypothetical protein BC829DRAFT_385037 [Chytridium lagenaria]
MFKQTVQKSTLWSLDRTRNYTLRIYPKIDRGFFLADNDWTCYRRNYFQVSATFTAVDVHGQRVELPCYVEVEDRLRTVTGFLINCVAKTHNGNKEIELVQHTAKRDKGPQSQPQARLCEPMDPTVRHEDSFHSSATANNGKRRAAQQYHVLLVELYVSFKVASAESAPLVVRGRAPGHYAAMSSKQAAQQAGIHTGDVLGPGAYDHVVHYELQASRYVAHHTPQAHYSTYQTQQHPDSSAHYYQPMHQQPQQTVTHYYQTQAYDSNLWAQQGHQATQFDPQTGAPQDHTLHYAQQQLTAGAYQPTPQMVDGNGHPIDANGNPIDSQQSQFDQSAAVEEQHDIQGVIQDAINGAVGGVEEQELQEELESPETAAPPGESLKSAKKRGRPKKVPGEEGAEANGSDLPPKKKRGRPRKEAAEEEPAEEEQSI